MKYTRYFRKACCVGEVIVIKRQALAGMMDDKIRDYTALNASLRHFSSFLCEIACSDKRPEKNDVIKAMNLSFPNVALKENEAALLFLCLLIAASLFIML